MQRVNNTNKSLTNTQTNNANPAVPSLGGPKTKVQFKAVPPLHNFIKSHVALELDNRKVGIYKLKKVFKLCKFVAGHNDLYIILSYKIGKTRYKIKSVTKEKRPKVGAKNIEGHIEISKGIFQNRMFELSELPKNIIDSINQNITAFNKAYGDTLDEANHKKVNAAQKKKQGFFKDLDV